MTQASAAAPAIETIEIVRTQDRLAEIGAAWRDLCESAHAPVFQSHAWISAWRGALADWNRRELCVVVAWIGDSMQAVAPFAIYKKGGLRILEWAAREYSDYCDLVLRPGVDPSLLDRMWGALESGCQFDFALLTHVRPDACVRALSGRLRAHHREAASSQLVSEAATGDAWFEAHPKKFRQNFRRGQKILEENASLAFRLLAQDEPMGPALEKLAEWKRQLLGRNGVEAPLFVKDSAMLPALVGAIAREGLLRPFVIERDGKIIAISINFEHRGALMAYLTSYDPEFSRGSPGIALMVDYIRWALDRGLSTVDFLCGDEAFKGRVATHTTRLGSLCVGRTLLGKTILLADALRHRMQSQPREASSD